MEEVTLKCEVITPMFMAGADGKTPELRPSEFKGMMRFWWRAIKAMDNICELRKEEAKIFGGTGTGEGKSKVGIRILKNEIQKEAYRPLPHSQNKRFVLQAVMPGSKFEVSLFCRDKSECIFYKNIFILSALLGGFGKRARRGFGSIKIEGEEINLDIINNRLNLIQESFSVANTKIVNKNGSGYYPWIKEIQIGKKYSDTDTLLKVIGQASHEHNDPSLGNADPRMASPVYVSVIEINEEYFPIITTLNISFPQGYPRYDFSKQKSFKGELL